MEIADQPELPNVCFPPWIDLPPEITSDILQRLGALEILNSAQKVCTTWWKVSKNPSIWRLIRISCLPIEGCSRIEKEMMCRQAVDRSQGQVNDITLTSLGNLSDSLISYIADRCCQLRAITLDFRFVDEPIKCVIEAVKKLSLLEELRLYVLPDTISGRYCELIKTAGNSCPMLKSFTLNRKDRRDHDVPTRDDMALAIAKWMPGLRHLGLARNPITNRGLRAILDGCIHLESLDLRWCSLLRLKGELGRRCAQQLRDLRLEEYHDTEPEETRIDYGDLWYDFDHTDREEEHALLTSWLADENFMSTLRVEGSNF